MAELLEVKELVCGSGRVEILHGLSLATEGARSIGLFGPNGHGKTTLLRCLSGLLPVWSGALWLDGVAVNGLSAQARVELGLVHCAQGNLVFPNFSVREALRLGAFPRRARAGEKAALEMVFELFPKLNERQAQSVRTLSGGERQMLSLGVALMAQPRLLILDEPTLGLAPRLKDELCSAIRRIAATGVSLVVVEQDVEFLLGLVDHLFMVNHGVVSSQVRPGQSLAHQDIMALYFGDASAPVMRATP